MVKKEGARLTPLTRGPGFHWFGYYDKLQFDPGCRYVLANRVEFEGRSPRERDRISVGMIDRERGNRWIKLGESSAWCWQQGCMLQWLPGSDHEVIWNDRRGDGFCSQVLDVFDGKMRTLPRAVYTLAPDGRSALSLDFARTGRLRPGYGYVGADASAADTCPEDRGIYGLDLVTGESRLLVSFAEVARLPSGLGDLSGEEHWFNHLLFNPDGSRFVFLNRWRSPGGGRKWGTRALVADPDGGGLRVIHDRGYFSHFIWRDPRRILAWTKTGAGGEGFYLIDTRTLEYEPVGRGSMDRDGHCSYLPGGRWIVCDTYPTGDDRDQRLYLFGPAAGVRAELATLPAPTAYSGEWRCDLHPRCSPDGRCLTVDSAHAGGRQVYLLELPGELAGA